MPIKSASDLVTSREKTRAGFINMVFEKNLLARPYIDEARTLKSMASKAKAPKELITMTELRVGLLSASGISNKSLQYLTEDDKTAAIKTLVEDFLIPANDQFVDELIYRYLLTKGDALGGQARNLAGALGERKFFRSMLSVLNLAGISYYWLDNESGKWITKPLDDIEIEKRMSGLHWVIKKNERVLLKNIKVPVVDKGIDLCLYDANLNDVAKRKTLIGTNQKYIALGELKGGIDPAGADEHWKTANTALIRIRESFLRENLKPKTFFVGAAIELAMANEIFDQIKNGVINNAANLTNDDQLTEVCQWIVNS